VKIGTTLEGLERMRYLVYRDGSMVLPGDGPVRLDDLDPASRRIVDALLAAGAHAEEAPKLPAEDDVPARRMPR
jgi:hypothetical protein